MYTSAHVQRERGGCALHAQARAHTHKHIHPHMQVILEVFKEGAAPKRGWFSRGSHGKGSGYVLCVRAACSCAGYY